MDQNDLGIEERLRRKMSRATRSKSIAVRFTEAEAEAITQAAKRSGVTVREWARDAMLQASSSAQTNLPIFTELVALRMFNIRILRHLATTDEQLSEEAYAQIMTDVRLQKRQAAAELLQQYTVS